MPESGAIVTIKRFTYRDALEEWSNKYHFTGTKPTASGSWKALADAIINLEKALVSDRTKFVRAYGYGPGAISSEWTHDYLGPPDTSVAGGGGTFTPGSMAPGDAAMVLRAFTGRYTTKGKKIYVRKYFHDVWMSATDPDEVMTSFVSACNGFGATMIGGTLPGSVKWSDSLGSTLTDPVTSPYITTRTLKRRGKRPPS